MTRIYQSQGGQPERSPKVSIKYNRTKQKRGTVKKPHHVYPALGLVNGPWLIPLLRLSLCLSHLFPVRRFRPDVRSPRHSSAPSSPGPLASNGSDPLPGATDFAASALSLAGPNIAILLNHGLDSLPDLLPFRERMHRSKHIISQVWEEQPGVVDVILSKLPLGGQSSQNQVHQGRDLSGSSDMPAVAGSQVEDCEDKGS